MQRTPDILTENCPTRRGGTCTRCQDACPTDAISLPDGPFIDTALCTACGVCAAACPAGAILHPAGSTLLKNLSRMPVRRKVNAVCFNTRHTDNATLRINACLSSLGVETLVGIAALDVHTMRFIRGNCRTCAKGDSLRGFMQSLAQTRNLLYCTRSQTAFSIVAPAPPDSPCPHNKKRPAANGSHLSRRGFFQLARSGLASPHPTDHEQPHPEQTHGRQTPPSSRIVLHRALKQLRAAGGMPVELPNATLSINSACTACGACAKSCPTGALEFSETDGSFQLRFSVWKCIDCGLCEKICRTRSLSRHKTRLDSFVNDNPIPLVSGPLLVCSRCRAHSATLVDDRYCQLCARKFSHV